MVKVFASTLFLFLSSACVPFRLAYYVPTDATTAFELSHCGLPHAGYADDIGESQDLLVTVRAEHDGIVVVVQFTTRPQDVLRFSSDNLTVLHGASEYSGVLTAISPTGIVDKRITESLTPDEERAQFPGPHDVEAVSTQTFTLASNVKGEFSGDILLTLPTLYINDAAVDIPPINMIRKKKAGFEYC